MQNRSNRTYFISSPITITRGKYTQKAQYYQQEIIDFKSTFYTLGFNPDFQDSVFLIINLNLEGPSHSRMTFSLSKNLPTLEGYPHPRRTKVSSSGYQLVSGAEPSSSIGSVGNSGTCFGSCNSWSLQSCIS